MVIKKGPRIENLAEMTPVMFSFDGSTLLLQDFQSDTCNNWATRSLLYNSAQSMFNWAELKE